MSGEAHEFTVTPSATRRTEWLVECTCGRLLVDVSDQELLGVMRRHVEIAAERAVR